MSYIYHERQLGGLCGVHCLNNLLQGPLLGPGDLAEIGVQLDQQEQSLVREAGAHGGLEGKPYNVDSSADGGNFSIQVLALALKRFGLELVSSRHPDVKTKMKDPASATTAFLCQYRDHWFAIRQVADCWWNLNSTRKRPASVGPFYLAAWLSQLSAEGYTIFLVMGKLPSPAQPTLTEKHSLENFHEIFDLLQRANKSGGNPLTGEDSDQEVVIPPELVEDRGWQQGLLGRSPAGATKGMALAESKRTILAAEEAAMREMGFKEPSIRIALPLANCNSETASELLLTMPVLDPLAEIEASAWAREIQACVLSLDRNPAPFGFLSQALLRLAALLQCDEEIQKAARENVDLRVLSEFLDRILKHKSQAWAPNAAAAGHAAVKLLSSASKRQRGQADQPSSDEDIYVSL